MKSGRRYSYMSEYKGDSHVKGSWIKSTKKQTWAAVRWRSVLVSSSRDTQVHNYTLLPPSHLVLVLKSNLPARQTEARCVMSCYESPYVNLSLVVAVEICLAVCAFAKESLWVPLCLSMFACLYLSVCVFYQILYIFNIVEVLTSKTDITQSSVDQYFSPTYPEKITHRRHYT